MTYKKLLIKHISDEYMSMLIEKYFNEDIINILRQSERIVYQTYNIPTYKVNIPDFIVAEFQEYFMLDDMNYIISFTSDNSVGELEFYIQSYSNKITISDLYLKTNYYTIIDDKYVF